jgi:hypothetical protein
MQARLLFGMVETACGVVRAGFGQFSAFALTAASIAHQIGITAEAFSYNTLGVPLAAMGFISPIFCVTAMAVSDLIVIGDALRLLGVSGIDGGNTLKT